MARIRHLLSTFFILLSIEKLHSQVTFELLCSTDVEVSGMSSLDGNDDFEIDLYETKFLPEDTIYRKP